MSHDLTQSFLADICANPEDDTPRLVFADWVEEQGEEARAEFIRVQIERTRLPRWDARQVRLWLRERELLKAHETRWMAALPRLKGVTWEGFRRGFVAEARFASFGAFKTNQAACWAAAPIEAAWLRWPRKADLADEIPPVPCLRELTITARMVSHADADRLATSPLLSTIRILDITRQNMGVVDLDRLVSSPYLRQVESLRIGHNNLGNAGVETLINASLPMLTELDLSESSEYGYPEDAILDLTGLQSLAAWPGLAQIRKLNLSGNRLATEGLRALLSSPHVAGLKELGLALSGLDPAAHEAFLAATPELRLESLDMSWNALQPNLLNTMASAPYLGELKALQLDNCELRDKGVVTLATASLFSTLRVLLADSNYIGAEGLQVISHRSPPHLHTLRLRHNTLGLEGAAYLAGSRAFDPLLFVDLSNNDLTDGAARVLGATKHLPNLLVLQLAENPIKKRAMEALASSPLGKRLALLKLEMADTSTPF